MREMKFALVRCANFVFCSTWASRSNWLTLALAKLVLVRLRLRGATLQRASQKWEHSSSPKPKTKRGGCAVESNRKYASLSSSLTSFWFVFVFTLLRCWEKKWEHSSSSPKPQPKKYARRIGNRFAAKHSKMLRLRSLVRTFGHTLPLSLLPALSASLMNELLLLFLLLLLLFVFGAG